MTMKRKQAPLRPLSIVTFLNFAARGLTSPFISLYLISVGFTGTQIGIVLSLSAALRLFLPPLLNTIADRTGLHRRFFYGLVAGNATATLSLSITAFSQVLLGANVILRDSLDAPTASLLTQLTITRLDQLKQDIYGKIRAWGSVGWAVTTFGSGLIFAAGGYFGLFLVAALLNYSSLILWQKIPASTLSEPLDKTKNDERAPLQRPRGFYILMVSWFMFFIGMSSIGGFVFPFFQQELGASNAMIGILSGIGAIAEVPYMMVVDRMMRRLNIRWTMMIGMLGMASIWTIYTFLPSAIWIVPLMFIRGAFYTFQYVANTLIISRISHPANAATNLTIAQVTVPALAQLLFAPIAGIIFDMYGARVLLRLVSLVAVLAVLLLVAFRKTLAATPTTSTATL